jgi:hypothetical protein
MNRNRVFIGLLTLSLTALAALSAMGQRNMARNQVDAIVRNLETSSDVFSRDFKNRNTSTSERRIVDNFENAIDRLRRNFDRNDNWWSTRNDVQSIMDESQQVNQLMNNERFARALKCSGATCGATSTHWPTRTSCPALAVGAVTGTEAAEAADAAPDRQAGRKGHFTPVTLKMAGQSR